MEVSGIELAAYSFDEFVEVFFVWDEFAYPGLVMPAKDDHRKHQHGTECYAGADGCPDNTIKRYQYITRYKQGEKSDTGADCTVTYLPASDEIVAEYTVAP